MRNRPATICPPSQAWSEPLVILVDQSEFLFHMMKRCSYSFDLVTLLKNYRVISALTGLSPLDWRDAQELSMMLVDTCYLDEDLPRAGNGLGGTTLLDVR